jgi:hypothetical protein
MQGVAAFDVAKFTKRRGNAHALRKSPRNVNKVFNAFLHEVLWSAVRPRTALCHATGYGQESGATRFLL